MIPDLPADQLELMLARALLMRRFDERVVKLHDERAFPGHYHVYFGQEATGVAACQVARSDDYLFTTHRNHGHLLARGVAPRRLMAEVLGRVDGTNRGVGGTFHCSDPSVGVLHTTGVVGGSAPLAVGVAFGCQRKAKEGVMVYQIDLIRITLCVLHSLSYPALSLYAESGLRARAVPAPRLRPPESQRLRRAPHMWAPARSQALSVAPAPTH